MATHKRDSFTLVKTPKELGAETHLCPSIGPLTVDDYINLSDGRYEYHAVHGDVSMPSPVENMENNVLMANHGNIGMNQSGNQPSNASWEPGRDTANTEGGPIDSTTVKARVPATNPANVMDVVPSLSDTLSNASARHDIHAEGPRLLAPSLPQQKLYHAFFSFSCEDKDWVMDIIKKLEAPPYGFRCCYDERDFQPGVTILQNIIASIHSSIKTVIILSPDFVDSPWCSYETRVTMEMDLDLRQKLLIPVLLRPCKVPEFLGRLTYLDVAAPMFWERFVQALCDVDVAHSTIENVYAIQPTVNFNPSLNNGQILATVEPKSKWCNVQFNERAVPDALVSNGIHMSPSAYHSTVRDINSLNKIWICKGLIVKYMACSCFFELLSIGICVVVLLFFIPTGIYSGLEGTGFVVLSLIILLYYLYQRARLMSQMKKVCDTANRKFSQQNVLMLYRNRKLRFFYYDTKPCQEFVKDGLRESGETQSGVHLKDVTETTALLVGEGEERREAALVYRYMWDYLNLLSAGKRPACGLQRHTVQGMCLCQYVLARQERSRT